MARIKNTKVYVFDTVPESSSFLVGSDQGDGRITKSYRIDTVFGLLPSYGYFTDAPADGQPYLRQDHKWVNVPPSGVGSVFSVFGRTGAVTGQLGDYEAFYAKVVHTHVEADITDLKDYLLPSDIGNTVQAWSADLDAVTGINTGDQTSILGIEGTKALFNTSLTDGNFMFIGDPPTHHTHVEADITDLQDYLLPADIDTLSELNSIITDATLIDTGDPRLSDSRHPLYHTHVEADITDLKPYLVSVNMSDINATGTPSASTWLRGDGTWGSILAGVSSVFGRTADVVALESDYSAFYQLLSQKGLANGYTPLDSGAKIPIEFLPDSVIGQVEYQGAWNASTNIPDVGDATLSKGHYYVTSVAGTYLGIHYAVGDWIISNGTDWERVDNTDAVTSVFGRIGAVVANVGDYSSFYLGINDTAVDSDLLDGLNSSQFLRSDINNTYTGQFFRFDNAANHGIVTGSDSQRLLIGGGSTWSGTSGAYLSLEGIDYGGAGLGGNAIFSLPAGKTLQVNGGTVWTSSNDGEGSGLDADLLDGLNSSQFLRKDISDTTVGKLTVNTSQASNFAMDIINNDTGSSSNGLIVRVNNSSPNNTVQRWWVNGAEVARMGADSNFTVTGTGNFGGNVNAQIGIFSGGSNALRIYGSGAGTGNIAYASFYESNGTTRQGYFGFGGGTNSNLTIRNDTTNTHLQLQDNGALTYYDGALTGTVWTSQNDGSGSGLDADLLDGISGAGYMVVNSQTTNNNATNSTSKDTGAVILTQGGLGVEQAIFSGGNMNAPNFVLTSDRRKKKNIKALKGDSLPIKWKEFELKDFPGEVRYGVIAQEVQKYAPELVSTNGKGELSVKYIDLFAKKLAEKDKQIESLEERIELLEEKFKLLVKTL